MRMRSATVVTVFGGSAYPRARPWYHVTGHDERPDGEVLVDGSWLVGEA